MNPAARRGMMALRVASLPVANGPVLQLKMSPVEGIVKASVPKVNPVNVSADSLVLPLTVPAAACVSMDNV